MDVVRGIFIRVRLSREVFEECVLVTRGVPFQMWAPVGRARQRKWTRKAVTCPWASKGCCVGELSACEWMGAARKGGAVCSVSLPWLDEGWNFTTTLVALGSSFLHPQAVLYVMQVSRTAYSKWGGGIYCVACGCYRTHVGIDSVKNQVTLASIIFKKKTEKVTQTHHRNFKIKGYLKEERCEMLDAGYSCAVPVFLFLCSLWKLIWSVAQNLFDVF